MSTMRHWLSALPKVELHLHLEGAIPLPALKQLIDRHGGDPQVKSLEDLRRRLTYADFPAFIEAWIWKNGFLRDYDDFSLIAEAMARELKAQNIVYAEVFFSPSRFAEHGLTPQGLATAIRTGLDRVDGVTVRLIADLVRDHGPQEAARTFARIDEVRDQGIVGIGIGGSEHLHPPEPFAAVYDEARRRGYRTSAHAGEAAGPDSVRGAIEALRVDRIGHGIRAIEDPAVVALLADRQVPLEVCPLSNVATGVVPDIAAHPVAELWRQGLNLTISTDDPGMFHNTLVDDFAALHDSFGFSADDIRTLTLNAIAASWQDDREKDALRTRITNDPAWLAELEEKRP